MELHFHPSIFIGVDLRPARASHDGCLRPLHDRTRGDASRAERLFVVLHLDPAPVRLGRRGRGSGPRFLDLDLVADPDDQPFDILVRAREFLELELRATAETGRCATSMRALVLGVQLLQPNPGQAITAPQLDIAAGVVIDLGVRLLMRLGLFSTAVRSARGFSKSNARKVTRPGRTRASARQSSK